MAGTRSSTRNASSQDSNGTSGTKRKADQQSSPPSKTNKRGRPSKTKDDEKEQKTLEETMNGPDSTTQDDRDVEMEDDKAEEPTKAAAEDEGENGEIAEFQRPDGCWFWLDNATYKADTAGNASNGQKNGHGDNAITEPGASFKGETKEGESKGDPEKALKDSRGGAGANALDQVKADPDDEGKTSKKEDNDTEKADDKAPSSQANGGEAITEDASREKAQPSNILEKGIIYFFTRGRVGVTDIDSPQDLQRSYFVLRPLPAGAKLTDGAIQDEGNNRLVALPKKVWPKSGKDRFMAFVEKAKTTMAALKEEFFDGSEYSTKTVGTRQTPPVTPLGEGVYAMTSTGGGQGTTHLAYMLTIPTEIGEVQQDVGLEAKGSFVLSLKNPESKGPANAQLPQTADFPKEFIDEFAGRGWMAVDPKHLNYDNAQMLLIGENFENSNNLEATHKDSKDESKETPQEELEKLEHEDDLRVEHMKGDDTIFADLGISSKDYPKVMTTW